MKHIFTVLALAFFTSTASFAAELKVDSIHVSRSDSLLRLDIVIDPHDINPGRDREVVYTPVVRSASGSDSIVLPSVTIAGRNRYYSHLRNNRLQDGEMLYNAGSNELVNYTVSVPFMPWMERSRIDMGQTEGHCCDKPRTGKATPLAALDFAEVPFVPTGKPPYVELTGDEAIELTAEGSAFIDFIVNRTEIRPSYRRNKREIAKIIASIDKVKNDPDATITRITIKGYASPEGSYSNNVRLAMGRTAALKDYVREHYHFAPEIMSTDYEPEDWAGLRAWVDKCTLPNRDGLLSIIDSDMQPDPKDHEMRRRYPSDYKVILDSVYPALRHSDYTVRYRIRTYQSIEELIEAYEKTPERLRPVDYQRIAAHYGSGTPAFDEVMLAAVERFPHDAAANLNAATIAMKAGDTKAAVAYLDRSGDSAEATYMRGVLAAATGDLDRADRCFRLASDAGLELAARELDALRAHRNRKTVEYLIKPSGKKIILII